MNEINFQEPHVLENDASRKIHFFQIDFLKAVMIFLVIFDHFVSWNIKNEIGVALWERISIPVFLVILGFNMGHSFGSYKNPTLKELYSWNYFKKKILRYIFPFLILYAVSTFIGLFMYGFDFELMYYSQYYPDHGAINLIYLIMPFWGPGNWFIPVLFQSILVVPLLYWMFTKNRVITLVFTFIVEMSMQFIVFLLFGKGFTSWEQVHIYLFFACSILFYLSAVGLGMWFSFGYGLTEKRNRFIWVLFPLSWIYLVAYQFFNFRFRIDGMPLIRGDYSFLVFPYSAFLMLLALEILPYSSQKLISKKISLIGKATYHILLIQILGYAMITAWWGTHYGMDLLFDPTDLLDLVVLWIINVWFGILWYKIEKLHDRRRRILYYLNFFIIYPSMFLLTFWAQGFWIPIPLLIIIAYALSALVVHYRIKKPLPTKLLAVWTGFLLINFASTILQVTFFSINEFWIFLIPIGIYLAYAIYYTYNHDNF
jgi:peptidoglycan/LPS O-acetylase OafA/YrhL